MWPNHPLERTVSAQRAVPAVPLLGFTSVRPPTAFVRPPESIVRQGDLN
jgi:hypothetical protein